MSYSFYMGDRLLPVAPSRLEIVYKNKLRRFDLADGEEIAFPAVNGLAEIRFFALLPQTVYPFAVYQSGFVSGGSILRELLDLKQSAKPFRFIVFRKTAGGRELDSTNIKAVFSELRVREDAREGNDIYIDVKLNEYRDYAVKNVRFVNGVELGSPVQRIVDGGARSAVKTYRVEEGDTLWLTAHKLLGDGSRYKEIYSLNKTNIDLGNKGKDTTTYTVFAGQVLDIPKR